MGRGFYQKTISALHTAKDAKTSMLTSSLDSRHPPLRKTFLVPRRVPTPIILPSRCRFWDRIALADNDFRGPHVPLLFPLLHGLSPATHTENPVPLFVVTRSQSERPSGVSLPRPNDQGIARFGFAAPAVLTPH